MNDGNLFMAIFNIIVAIVFKLISLILLPIDYIIANYIPVLSTAFASIATFVANLAIGLGWAISAAGIPTGAIILIGFYYIMKLNVPIQMYFIKLAIKWYKTLKI